METNLPSTEATDKILRYEITFHRQISQVRSELERLRRGEEKRTSFLPLSTPRSQTQADFAKQSQIHPIRHLNCR